MNKIGSVPNETSLGSVYEMPAIGGVVLPANVIGVMPEGADLLIERETKKP